MHKHLDSDRIWELNKQSDWSEKILPLRRQAELKNLWLKKRIDTILPEIMNRENIDMWLVIAREYNEDPVIMSMLPAPMMTARRRTILVFYKKPDGEIERICISRPGTGLDAIYQEVWTNPAGSKWAPLSEMMPGNQSPEQNLLAKSETQWECLARIIRERDPQSIGINVSETFAFADGLTHSEYGQLTQALDETYKNRLLNAERLAIGWMERRLPEEIAAYDGVVQIAHGIISEAFSSRVTHPGVTRNSDLVWWMHQRINRLGLTSWFPFEVSIFRQGVDKVGDDEIIMPGDVLHCDVGLHYLGLATDTQENAYVLKRDEVEAPEGIRNVQKQGNVLQDYLAAEYVAGRTGNEVLAKALSAAKAGGLIPSIYVRYAGRCAWPGRLPAF